ncbi:hypothetical protein GGS21DRAFT_548928 [Xylaria nigripes]|nr:hypothetical protein GGS21DRAFT_548928 [Xylaria nigripes]
MASSDKYDSIVLLSSLLPHNTHAINQQTEPSPAITACLHNIQHSSSIAVSADEDSISPTKPSTSSLITSGYAEISGFHLPSILPAFRQPRLFTNEPTLFPVPSVATTTLSPNSVPDKVSCCGACADYCNCITWRFVPASVGNPSNQEPGVFNPWRGRDCEIAYHTGKKYPFTVEGNNTTSTDIASICPNGRVPGMLNGKANQSSGRWLIVLYYDRWNEGACGGLGDVLFQKERGDPGIGDGDALCTGSV